MTSHARRLSSERGSILVQVGVAIIVLIAFTTFVADYGLMWVSRRQAQNAADAGALAGAIALGYDNYADRSDTGPAKQSAHDVAISNLVAAEAPIVDISTDVYFYPDDPSKFPAECADDTCIRVDVYRNQDEGNPLPIWFGQLIGLVNQGVRATAIARASFGNATDCMKPWAVVDRWEEHWEDGMPATLPWNSDSNFDKYDKDGNVILMPPDADVYTPAQVTYTDTDGDGEGDTPDWGTYVPGTGFHPFDFDGSGNVSEYTDDYGLQLNLKQGDAGDWNFGAGWFMRLDLSGFINPDAEYEYEPPSDGGANFYRWAIKNCVGTTLKIGQEIPFENAPGSATGPTRQGVETDGDGDGSGPSLINQDPTATWVDDPDGDGPLHYVDSPFAISPRIVAIPLVNPDALMESFKNGKTTVPIGNIAGFFIEGVMGSGVNQTVYGRLMTMPGLKAEGEDTNAPSAFLRLITLIR
jgi:putative Flp pilus-assembly TadE/G-like protein